MAAANQSEMAAQQFSGGGPVVVVRNTFLDFDDAPAAPALFRSKTAPPSGAKAAQDSDEDEEEDEEEEEEAPTEKEQDQPPPPMDLCARQTTRDWFESSEDWNWAGAGAAASAGSMPPVGTVPAGMAPAGAVQPGGPPQMMYAPQHHMQMVMVPVAMMPQDMGGQAVQFNGGPQGGPEQLPLQRPDRGARWPSVPEANAINITAGMIEGAAEPAPTAPGALAPAAESGSSGPSPQPQTLTRTFSINSACFRVHWTVDARKLRGNDKQAVSPPFELSFGSQFPNVTFKMMIYPKIVNDSKGGASFKKAKGRGYVQLKCEAELSEAIANVQFRISIGSGDRQEDPRGPVSHNFSSSAVCGLPKDLEEWDFQSVVDQESMTFVVCLEIVPKAAGR